MILESYADHLADINLLAEAGLGNSTPFVLTLAYEIVGQKLKALESYAKGVVWKECLNVAYSLSMSSHEIGQLADRLANSLLERRQFNDAARLYVDYASDESGIKNAVKALIKGYQFSEAIRIVHSAQGLW